MGVTPLQWETLPVPIGHRLIAAVALAPGHLLGLSSTHTISLSMGSVSEHGAHRGGPPFDARVLCESPISDAGSVRSAGRVAMTAVDGKAYLFAYVGSALRMWSMREPEREWVEMADISLSHSHGQYPLSATAHGDCVYLYSDALYRIDKDTIQRVEGVPVYLSHTPCLVVSHHHKIVVVPRVCGGLGRAESAAVYDGVDGEWTEEPIPPSTSQTEYTTALSAGACVWLVSHNPRGSVSVTSFFPELCLWDTAIHVPSVPTRDRPPSFMVYLLPDILCTDSDMAVLPVHMHYNPWVTGALIRPEHVVEALITVGWVRDDDGAYALRRGVEGTALQNPVSVMRGLCRLTQMGMRGVHGVSSVEANFTHITRHLAQSLTVGLRSCHPVLSFLTLVQTCRMLDFPSSPMEWGEIAETVESNSGLYLGSLCQWVSQTLDAGGEVAQHVTALMRVCMETAPSTPLFALSLCMCRHAMAGAPYEGIKSGGRRVKEESVADMVGSEVAFKFALEDKKVVAAVIEDAKDGLAGSRGRGVTLPTEGGIGIIGDM
ncbi:hypothetical protein KIPB_000824 [Kipferlia bialata]|uniref:Uncharacterized protein n=1 Tax=Kipferlia bialata TaxID=797122 RepID=A0A9K3GEP7_9EUKA|nr:hypothetical protein KIPB_000824 [Kipferlia bialata]|eukprot:g824.t1